MRKQLCGVEIVLLCNAAMILAGSGGNRGKLRQRTRRMLHETVKHFNLGLLVVLGLFIHAPAVSAATRKVVTRRTGNATTNNATLTTSERMFPDGNYPAYQEPDGDESAGF